MERTTMNGSLAVSRERAAGYAKERPAAALAASAWLHARGLREPSHGLWEVAIALDVVCGPASPTVNGPNDSRFHIAIAGNEWGFFFCHRRKVSWIRVTDVPFINERDEYALLGRTPPLRDLGKLVQSLEERYDLQFNRMNASIRTSLLDADHAIRIWLVAAI
jgi:hypothetical protein